MRHKYQTILTLFSFLLILTMFSCEVDCRKKGNCPPEYYRYELGEARDYLWAAKGSYWIYRNTKTGEMDTQTCMSAKTYWVNVRGSYDYSRHITIDYEVLSRSIYSSFNKWKYDDKSSQYDPNYWRPFNLFVFRAVDSEGINNPFFFPFQKNDKGGTSSSVTTCTNIDTSMTVNGILYEHVVVFEIDIDEIWEDKLLCIRPNAKYYWAKDVGLIKKEMNRCGYSWELIENFIMK